MLKDVIGSYSECKDLLCSYFMKTIMFWISEELSKCEWKTSNLISCFLRCVGRLIYCVEYSVCWHYFVPENNLFENKIRGRAREILLEKLFFLHSYGWRCILFSDQVSNFHDVMWNLKFKPHTAVSNAVEKILNSRALRHLDYSFASTDLKGMNMLHRGMNQILSCPQSPMKYMYAYYISKGCFLRAQFMLPYYTSDTNKYKYKKYKSCLSTLLQNIYHDAVSGWLMLASYFYKTKQYSKALQITMYSISKCSHEKLYPCMHILDIHHELLKLKSLEKKEDTVYLWKKLLVDDISFARHSQLIPDELPMNEDNPPRFIPSVAYAFFLRFLCHYHQNNVRQCQDVLNDLQYIIAEHYLIAVKPFNFVPVALQLLYDLQSARQTFLQSLD
ncbi:Hypothetical predicted protein [Mytilus galloprovincialis]|uniref:Mab-21-like HhH/H2TH-like domain-containing protein n=1 Tax=Mytilus galloprovincialis TaxID=29158 RepID=A0A8B6BVS9_MYTGA|nr:Hypothetical predicted protein [Mytilus galloprovincialis]